MKCGTVSRFGIGTDWPQLDVAIEQQINLNRLNSYGYCLNMKLINVSDLFSEKRTNVNSLAESKIKLCAV